MFTVSVPVPPVTVVLRAHAPAAPFTVSVVFALVVALEPLSTLSAVVAPIVTVAESVYPALRFNT